MRPFGGMIVCTDSGPEVSGSRDSSTHCTMILGSSQSGLTLSGIDHRTINMKVPTIRPTKRDLVHLYSAKLDMIDNNTDKTTPDRGIPNECLQRDAWYKTIVPRHCSNVQTCCFNAADWSGWDITWWGKPDRI